MLLWVTFAIMTAAALAALLWPLYRHGAADAAPLDAELAVYRDQLTEIDHDAARGLIGAAEAQGARNEVSRRMLAAAASREAPPLRASPAARRAALAIAVVGIPLVALSTYLSLGSPGLPGLPRAERMAAAVEHADFAAMVAKVEAHLADNPGDAQGWLVLAPAYRGMGRYREAAEAYARALQIATPTADLMGDYGEVLVLAEDGLVTARASEAFSQALELDRHHVKALFYRALADRQDGKHEEALATWRAMLEEAPDDAPWRAAVQRQTASLEREMSGAPPFDEADLASAEEMESSGREAMIRGMVDGLAERLEQDGDDLDGWLRLAQARKVLGEREAAVQALVRAEQYFSGDPGALARIAEARDSLGLGSGKEVGP